MWGACYKWLFFLSPERYGTGDDDEVLLIPDHRNLSPHASPQTRHDKVQQSSLMQMLQAGLYHYVALPVIKIRWVFIGKLMLQAGLYHYVALPVIKIRGVFIGKFYKL